MPLKFDLDTWSLKDMVCIAAQGQKQLQSTQTLQTRLTEASDLSLALLQAKKDVRKAASKTKRYWNKTLTKTPINQANKKLTPLRNFRAQFKATAAKRRVASERETVVSS